MITGRWSFHTGRVNTLSWTADGQHCASGSLDTHVYVWSVQKPMKNIAMVSQYAHRARGSFCFNHGLSSGLSFSARRDEGSGALPIFGLYGDRPDV